MDGNLIARTQDETYQLPNGMFVYHLNKYETDFTYNEIFEERVYLKHGIKLEDNAYVFDIGANIGLFMMFVKHACSNAKIFAFEPAPELYRLLQLNAIKYGSSVQVYKNGVSDEEKEAKFTYYPNYSIMSGFYTNKEEDKTILSAGVRHQTQKSTPTDSEVPERFIERFVNDKLKEGIQIKSQLRTISSIMRESRIERINLLKIDAEKSELQILAGIDVDDWPKIDQIVIEVHNKKHAGSITSLLSSKRFKVDAEQEEQFVASGITNIFAIRL